MQDAKAAYQAYKNKDYAQLEEKGMYLAAGMVLGKGGKSGLRLGKNLKGVFKRLKGVGKGKWGNPSTLLDHFERHGKDFSAKNELDYAKKANVFFKNKDKYKIKVDDKGTTRVYDPKTNTFGSYNSNGTTKTFFKPTSKTFWDRQPGK